jgi:hypothetical protein
MERGVHEVPASHGTSAALRLREALLALIEIAVVVFLAANVATPEAVIAAVFILAVHRRTVLVQSLGPLTAWRARLPLILLLTIAIWSCILVVALLLDIVGLPRPDLSFFAGQVEGDIGALLLNLVWVWTVVAFGEEMLGRAFLIDRFEVLFGGLSVATPLAVIAAAILFGLAHAYQGPGGVLLTASIGLILGFVYLHQQRTIWVNVAVQGIVDTVAMLLLFGGVRFI